jgi:hypothetical protein
MIDLAKSSVALAECISVEDIINVMINQISEALGLREGVHTGRRPGRMEVNWPDARPDR